MRTTLQLLAAALPLASAWPTAIQPVEAEDTLEKRAVYPKVPPPNFSSGRDNCGAAGKCTVFNAEDQFIDVRPGSGHEFIAPGPNDLRGECPGLNAAANHGFLPRNGRPNTQQTIDGLGRAYSMSTDLAAILAVIAIAISGDPVAGQWSIGEGFKPASPLEGTPAGIVGTHNRYEGDASICKGDAYLHGGNVGYFDMFKFEHLYGLLGEDGLTQDKAGAQAYYTAEYSILNNPYYFSEPFSGLVAPDAHNFVINFMSNHSEEDKGGNLHGNVLKSFFAVTGKPGSFVHHEGQERIPYNWYKRPSSQPCTTASTNEDTVINNAIYPGIIRFGGNTGTKNSFVGIDTNDLTGGVYNGKTLLEGNALTCFFLQASQAGLANPIYPLLEPIGEIQSYLDKTIGPQVKALGCPELKDFNNTLFEKYPGASYRGETN